MKKLAIAAALACVALGINAQNPYLPLWEFVPDGEPYVFEDPDKPGQYRVYIYGSHDSQVTGYCGREQVVWSAPVDKPTDWRFDGVIFRSQYGPDGHAYVDEPEVLFAPDITERIEDGKKVYYFCPHVTGARSNMVAKGTRPDGPFVPYNFNDDNSTTYGCFGFDPAIFVDDDGRVYGYWGFERSYGAELDPTTMCTVKPGTEVVENMVSSRFDPGVFRFFEASSMRKIDGKYVFIYSRITEPDEWGLPECNYNLAYAYSDNPLGPWTYGGTIIDARARGLDEQGRVVPTACPYGNTHGSICKVGDQWYVFYHRQTGTNEFSRQAMVAPIDVTVADGKVIISEGEVTSEGFQIEGLNPLERHAAGIACYLTNPTLAEQSFPNFTFSGSYIGSVRSSDPLDHSYSLNRHYSPVINNTSGSTVGYKYFNFDHFGGRDKAKLVLGMMPSGVAGEIVVMADSPFKSKGGKEIGRLKLDGSDAGTEVNKLIDIKGIGKLKGKHPVYLKFSSPTEGESLCELYDLRFE